MQDKTQHIVKANSPKGQEAFYRNVTDELSRFAMGKYNKVTNYFE